MIFDKVSNAKDYKGISKALDTAIEDMTTRDFSRQQEGRTELSEGVYFFVSQLSHKDRTQARWECHDAYIDIQCCLSGEEETIDYANRDAISAWAKDGDGDVYFSDETGLGVPLPLASGYFAVFFPQDAHRPGIGAAENRSRKLVYKVPAL